MSDLVAARAATESEIARTVWLSQSYSAQVRDERGGRLHLDHDTLDQDAQTVHGNAVRLPDHLLVVGCVDGEVVGFARAALHRTAHAQLCMIDELIVHPETQGIGVGSAILERVREWAVTHRCEAIESQVLPGNRAAKNFFERLGMKTRKMRVSADLAVP